MSATSRDGPLPATRRPLPPSTPGDPPRAAAPLRAPRTIVNFGGNLRFRPDHYYEPRTDDEVLAILRQHAHGQVRVAAALHSWSGLVVSNEAVVCMRHWRSIQYEQTDDGRTLATVGAGWRIKDLLRELRPRGLTLPAIGLITEQMIAGAIATGTHGSGNQSLGHHIRSVRIAAYDPGRRTPDARHRRRAGSLTPAATGLPRIVLSVTFACRPSTTSANGTRYATSKHCSMKDAPLQHSFLVTTGDTSCSIAPSRRRYGG